VCAVEVESVGEAVDLEGNSGFERDFDDLFEVEGVWSAVVDETACGVAEAANSRMSHGVCDLAGEVFAVVSLSSMEAELHPVELFEYVVREVEFAVAPDVDFGAS
jgi:hypothetical protein